MKKGQIDEIHSHPCKGSRIHIHTNLPTNDD